MEEEEGGKTLRVAKSGKYPKTKGQNIRVVAVCQILYDRPPADRSAAN